MVFLQKEKRQEGPACRQAGQTLLIVVLVMVISLTIGLSIASKTITNLRTTTEEVSSAQALSAAETGVAQQLRSALQIEGSLQAGTAFKASLTPLGGANFLVNNGNVIPQDEGADVWLIEHNSSGGLVVPYSPWSPAPAVGTLTIYWGDSSTGCNNAALEIVKVTGTLASDAVSTRYGYDPCFTRSSSNNFISPTSSPPGGVVVSGKTFYYTVDISVTNGFLLRIIPLYANTIMAVTGTAALPSQGSIITSTGTSSNVVRKISVVANYYSLPSEFFTYGLFVPK